MQFFWKSLVVVSFFINVICALNVLFPRNAGVNTHQAYQLDRIQQNLSKLSEELVLTKTAIKDLTIKED